MLFRSAAVDAAVNALEMHFRSRMTTAEDGLLRTLAAADDAEDRLTDEEMFAVLRLLLNGGHRSTANAIGNCVCTLLAESDRVAAFQDCMDRTDALDRAVNELLRYDTSVQMAVRRARTDLELRGRRIRSGDTVNLVLGSANRDPDAFDDPDGVDFTRPPTGNAAFGFGVHECLGAGLARIEVREAIATLFGGTKHTLDAAAVQYHQALKFRGPVSLSLVFATVPLTFDL